MRWDLDNNLSNLTGLCIYCKARRVNFNVTIRAAHDKPLLQSGLMYLNSLAYQKDCFVENHFPENP